MDPKESSINDLSLAAYFIMNGVRLISAKKLGRSYIFLFEADPRIPSLKLAFLGSESSRFDACVRDLKRLLFADNS
jgi:hypothetical protein